MRIAIGIEYDGTAYNGWQRQRSGLGVQERVEQAVAQVAQSGVPRPGDHPVDADQSIASTARSLLRKLRKARRTGARLIGVAVSHFDEDRATDDQLLLFDDTESASIDHERDRQLTSAVDHINTRFGRDHIVRGSTVNPHH